MDLSPSEPPAKKAVARRPFKNSSQAPKVVDTITGTSSNGNFGENKPLSSSSVSVPADVTTSKRLVINQDERKKEPASDYKVGGYFQVKIGDILHDNYKIVRQLGWGGYSTVWLASHTPTGKYAAIKFSKSSRDYTLAARREIEYLKRLASQQPDTVGADNVTKLLDVFTVSGDNGTHQAVAIEALGPTLLTVMLKSNQQEFHLDQIRSISKQILEALHLLHENCGMIHCDIKPQNIMIEVREEDIQRLDPKSPHFDRSEASYAIDLTTSTNLVTIKLGDFGISQDVDEVSYQMLQTCTYRAPEVFLRSGITPAIDIWSVGCIVYELFTGSVLIECNKERDLTIERTIHLDQMHSLLGPLDAGAYENETNSTIIKQHFQGNGNLKGDSLYIPDLLRANIHNEMQLSRTNLDEAVAFIRGLLELDPKKRPTAKEALQHGFLVSKNVALACDMDMKKAHPSNE